MSSSLSSPCVAPHNLMPNWGETGRPAVWQGGPQHGALGADSQCPWCLEAAQGLEVTGVGTKGCSHISHVHWPGLKTGISGAVFAL